MAKVETKAQIVGVRSLDIVFVCINFRTGARKLGYAQKVKCRNEMTIIKKDWKRSRSKSSK